MARRSLRSTRRWLSGLWSIRMERCGGLQRCVGRRASRGCTKLNSSEAGKLRADFAAGEIGIVRGPDWLAAPLASARGASNAQEAAMAVRCAQTGCRCAGAIGYAVAAHG
jgi:hypothetical protein